MLGGSTAVAQPRDPSTAGSLHSVLLFSMFSMSGVKRASNLGVSNLQQVYRDVAHGKLRRIVHQQGETGYPLHPDSSHSELTRSLKLLAKWGPKEMKPPRASRIRYFKTGIKLKGHQPIPASPTVLLDVKGD